jgi:hypothetical protein
MKFRYLGLIAACTLLTAAFTSDSLNAQESYAGGYPVERVRVVRPEGHMPSLLYYQQRVIFQDIQVVTDGRGMTVLGAVITDFEADIVPSGTDLPTGQLEVEVEVQLYHERTNLRVRQGEVEHPRLDPTRMGSPVAGQSARFVARDTYGPYGFSRFQLPTMERPLAPGIYRLEAKVVFGGQTGGIRRALKYCSDWYGAEVVGQDDITLEPIFRRIIDEEDRHEEFYDQILNTVGQVSTVSVLYIGETLRDNRVTLTAPQSGTTRNPANFMIWSDHVRQVGEVLNYQNQFQQVDDELEELRSRDGVPPERIREAEEYAPIMRQTIQQNIDMLGGEASREETDLFRTHEAARQGVLESIMRFEHYLTQRYWCITEGHLTYAGWHTMNSVGFNIFNAIERNDMEAQPKQRRAELQRHRESEGGLEGVWERRREAWRFRPREVWDIVRPYLRTKEESDTWDADKFTMEVDGRVMIDLEKFSEFRLNHITSIIESINPLIEEVRTTNLYHNQVWPTALADVERARDLVLTLGFSYEYFVRVRQQDEPPERVTESWESLAEQMPGFELTRLFARARGAPGTIKTQFDTAISNVGNTTGLVEFQVLYRRAVESGAGGGDLPGSRRE